MPLPQNIYIHIHIFLTLTSKTMTTVLLNDFSKPSFIFTAASSTYFKGLVKMINKRTQATNSTINTSRTRVHTRARMCTDARTLHRLNTTGLFP